MKNNLGSDYFLLAHVDLDKARFHQGSEIGIEFTNEIDAWTKMVFKFRSQRYSDARYVRKDLNPLIYSVRSRLE